MLDFIILTVFLCICAAWIIGVAWFSYYALPIIFSSFKNVFVGIYNLIYEFWYRKELQEFREQERSNYFSQINYIPSRGHISLDAEQDAGCRLAG